MWRRLVATVAAAAAVVVGVAGIAYIFGGSEGQAAWVGNANIVGGVVGSVALIVAVVALLFPPQPRRRRVEPEPAPYPVPFLAARIGSYWTRQAQARGITASGALAVTWRWPAPDVGVPPDEVRGLSGVDADLAQGVVTDLHDRLYVHLARTGGHLVIVGEAGAGKTAALLLILLGGLAAHAHDRTLPVPVMLPAGDWDPKIPLPEWAAGRLVEDFPELAALPGGSTTLAELVAAGRLALFLDGFDEMPADLQAPALRGIREQAVGITVALTTRMAEYRQANTGEGLDAPAVVELVPPGTEERDRFLVHGSTATRAGWQAVVHHLNNHQQCPLAGALSMPLTLGLAREGFVRRPQDLLELEKTHNRQGIVQELLAQSLHQAFPDERAHERNRYWLSWLARRMGDQRELRWWLVATWFPRWQLEVAVAAAVSPLFAIPVATVLWWGYRPVAGIAGGLLAAPIGAGMIAILSSTDVHEQRRPGVEPIGWAMRAPRMRWLTTRQRIVGVGLGMIGGVLTGLLTAGAGMLRSGTFSPATVEVLFALGTLVGVGSLFEVRTWQRPISSSDDRTPQRAYRDDIRRTMQLTAVGIVVTSAVAVMQAWVYSLLAAAWGASPTVAHAILVVGAAIMLVLAISFIFKGGLGAGLTLALAGAVATVQDWGQDRINLAALLEHAADRNVLRRTGALYQFRHAALQDYLAGVVPAAPATHRPLPAVPAPIPDDLSPAQIRARAHELVADGDYEQALRWYLRLDARDMDSPAWQDVGDLHWQRGDRELAEAAYWQAIRWELENTIDELDEIFDTPGGLASLRLLRLHEVIIAERLADSDRWDNPETAAATAYALRVLGNIHAWHTDTLTTVNTLRRSLQYRPEDAHTWRCLADVYLDADDFDQAQHCYRQALRHAPGDPLAHRGLGETLHRAGDRDNAAAADAAALATVGAAPKPLFSTAQRARRMVDRSTRPRVAYIRDHARVGHVLGELFAADGLPTEAIAQLRIACHLYHDDTDRHPEDDVVWQWYGDASRALGLMLDGVSSDDALAAADDAYTRAHECGVDDGDMLARHADVRYLTGDLAAAEAFAQEAVRTGPSALAHRCLGDIRAERAQWEQAQEHYRAALTTDRTHVAAWEGLADVLFELDQPAKATDAYRTALDLEPDSTRSLLGLGEALLESEEPTPANLSEAIGHLEAAARYDTLDGWFADTALATALQLAGRHEAARVAADQHLPYTTGPNGQFRPDPLAAGQQDPVQLVTPTFPQKQARGNRRRRLLRAQEAVAWHRWRTQPDTARPWHELATIRLQRGRVCAAIDTYQAALEQFPGDPVLTAGLQTAQQRLQSRP